MHINDLKRQPKEWVKIFASHISVKRLIPRLYKEILNSQHENKRSGSEMGRGLE